MPPTPLYLKISATHEQVSTLVGFMERHGDLNINPKTPRVKNLWSELIGILNQIGVGPQKTFEQWKKTWTDIKYRTKYKALKMQEATGSAREALEFTEIEKRVYKVIRNKQSRLGLEMDVNEILRRAENQQDCIENDESADPVFIEFIDHTESLSPIPKEESSPNCSPSRSPNPSPNASPNPSPPPPPPLTESKIKRRRPYTSEVNIVEEGRKRPKISLNNSLKNKIKSEEDSQLQHQQLLELKRLELEKLRETNLHEREKVRAQLERDSLKIQQKLVTFLEDIKPALIKFLNK